MKKVLLTSFFAVGICCLNAAQTYLLEAEKMGDLGKFEVNQSDGSGYASLHSFGNGCRARGIYVIPDSGKYTILLRDESYGDNLRTMEILVDGKLIGRGGDVARRNDKESRPAWVWSKIGQVELVAGKHEIILRATGSHARPDALLLVPGEAGILADNTLPENYQRLNAVNAVNGIGTFRENAVVARNIAAEGMVLLKNEHHVLPLAGKTIAFFGDGQMNYCGGGEGSARVKTAYTVPILDAFQELVAQRVVTLDQEMVAKYQKFVKYVPTLEEINRSAEKCETAIFVISRNSGEGGDLRPEKGWFYLTDAEETLLSRLKRSDFKEIVVVVNSGSVMSLKFTQDPRINAVVLTWLPGMEGGAAAADLLIGKKNFSGKLADTFAGDYADYPAGRGDSAYGLNVNYDEGIFVGYRYFETIPGAAEKVVYPFGFGLSYTTFAITPKSFVADSRKLTVSCTVKNTGKIAGKEVIQLYKGSSAGLLEHPAKELIAFAKTKELAPGASCEIKFELDLATALRSFDDIGACGKIGCWILDKGNYTFYLGNSVRDTVVVGHCERNTVEILQVCGNLFTTGSNRELHADGSFTDKRPAIIPLTQGEPAPAKTKKNEKVIMLQDVAAKRSTLDDFISQLTIEEKINLCHGQRATYANGTGGIGDLPKYGVVNPQTADGPAGLRKTVPMTWFPCETLIACSWDTSVAEAMGKSIGAEGIATGIDILLGPGLNIHRDVLCGRNFEYYSEDPVVSGKMAAAMVRGLQSEGLGATIKHFAANNRENNRLYSSSNVSDRALREIYLRGFEIAVKEGNPWCVMSSYNKINHLNTGCHYQLLTTVLRKEWGFDGMVMTDWRTISELWQEVPAGNDLKMPVCADNGRSIEKMKTPWYPQEKIDESVRRILNLVMKTHRFCVGLKSKGNAPIHLRATDFTDVSSTSYNMENSKDGADAGLCLTALGPDPDNRDCAVTYFCDLERSGDFDLTLRASTQIKEVTVEVFVNGKSAGSIPLDASGKWQTTAPLHITLPAGAYPLVLVFHGLESAPGENCNTVVTSVGLNALDFKPVK